MSCSAGHYCPGCGRDTSPYALLKSRCLRCLDRPALIEALARCGVYEGRFQEMILHFKNGGTELLSVLGPLADSALQGAAFAGHIDLFVPVPLHWSRYLARGYNQATIIARYLKHQRAIMRPVLSRKRATHPQPSMPSPSARSRNVRNAFSLKKRHGVQGKAVCLVDDIKTTGATLNECAAVLQRGGAERVYALVLAVAGQKSHD